MLPLLIPMLTNVIGGLVADKAQDLAKEHVESMINRAIPPKAKELIDTIVKADPNNPGESMMDLISKVGDGQVELPALPDLDQDIELTVKVKFNPSTMELDIEKV